MPTPITRRTALKQLALAGAGLPLLGSATAIRAAETKGQPPAPPRFELGVASVSLKGLPLDNALEAVRRVGLKNFSLHRAHSPWENSPPAWQEVAQKIKAAGIAPLCCGVLYLKNDEPAMRRMFDYVKILGAPLFACSPEPAALPLLERLVKEYDLRAALHNHGPEDKVWPSPHDIWRAIQPLDARIGLCIDIGHTWRCGVDPAEVIQTYASRLYDVHLKDTLAAVGEKDVPVEVGRGHIDQRAVLSALLQIGYDRTVWFEYEKDPNDPVPGLAESVGYVKGLLKGMGAA